LNFQKPFKYQMNQQSISLPQLHVTREERKKKTPHFRKMLHSKYGFIHHWIWSQFTILLCVIESEVNSPCFSELLNLKSIHHASEFCQKYRIEVQYQKDFEYLEKMVGINLDLFQSTAIHSDTSLLFPLVLWVPASND
jgi:hypothetical protein